jgi:DNA-binding GntR family transcriptional regulator
VTNPVLLDASPAAVASPVSIATRLRDAIVQGDLSPGEQIRQADWAARLGVSRVPIREALKTLAAEGLLSHDHFRGYFVTRFGPREVAQIYLMRRLLESELLRSIEWPDAAGLAELERLGHAAAEAMRAGDFDTWNDLEHRFHIRLYALSPLNLVRTEVERLWILSNVYRTLAALRLGRALTMQAAAYYQNMLDALAAHDHARMVDQLSKTRITAERSYAQRLEQQQHARHI